jgi:hypothetical protein
MIGSEDFEVVDYEREKKEATYKNLFPCKSTVNERHDLIVRAMSM